MIVSGVEFPNPASVKTTTRFGGKTVQLANGEIVSTYTGKTFYNVFIEWLFDHKVQAAHILHLVTLAIDFPIVSISGLEDIVQQYWSITGTQSTPYVTIDALSVSSVPRHDRLFKVSLSGHFIQVPLGVVGAPRITQLPDTSSIDAPTMEITVHRESEPKHPILSMRKEDIPTDVTAAAWLYAEQMVGRLEHRSGVRDVSSGASDCSSFVDWVYMRAGHKDFNLDYKTRGIYKDLCTPVPYAGVDYADLVFVFEGGTSWEDIIHIGMLRNGYVIDNSDLRRNGKTGVQKTRLVNWMEAMAPGITSGKYGRDSETGMMAGKRNGKTRYIGFGRLKKRSAAVSEDHETVKELEEDETRRGELSEMYDELAEQSIRETTFNFGTGAAFPAAVSLTIQNSLPIIPIRGFTLPTAQIIGSPRIMLSMDVKSGSGLIYSFLKEMSQIYNEKDNRKKSYVRINSKITGVLGNRNYIWILTRYDESPSIDFSSCILQFSAYNEIPKTNLRFIDDASKGDVPSDNVDDVYWGKSRRPPNDLSTLVEETPEQDLGGYESVGAVVTYKSVTDISKDLTEFVENFSTRGKNPTDIDLKLFETTMDDLVCLSGATTEAEMSSVSSIVDERKVLYGDMLEMVGNRDVVEDHLQNMLSAFKPSRLYPNLRLFFVDDDSQHDRRFWLGLDDMYEFGGVVSAMIRMSMDSPAPVALIVMTDPVGEIDQSLVIHDDTDPEEYTDNVKLKGFAIQNGTKILLEKGSGVGVYRRIFTGQVTSVKYEEEKIILIAQGFGTELMTVLNGMEGDEAKSYGTPVAGHSVNPTIEIISSVFDIFGWKTTSKPGWFFFKSSPVVKKPTYWPHFIFRPIHVEGDKVVFVDAMYGRRINVDAYDVATGPDYVEGYKAQKMAMFLTNVRPVELRIYDYKFKEGLLASVKAFFTETEATLGKGIFRIDNYKYVVRQVSMWDILKEMQLRHPGHILDVRPFETGSSVVLLRPDAYYYKYANLYTVQGPLPLSAEEQKRITEYLGRKRIKLAQWFWSGDTRKMINIGPDVKPVHLMTETPYTYPGPGPWDHYGIHDYVQGECESYGCKTIYGPAIAKLERLETRKREVAEPVRLYHIAASGLNLISNEVECITAGTYNSIILNYGGDDHPKDRFDADDFDTYELRISEDLDEGAMKVFVDAWPQCIGKIMARQYAVSLLNREFRNAYYGKIVILGNENIMPYHRILVVDDTTDTYGFVDVHTVIHQYGPEGDYTIITPAFAVDVLLGEGAVTPARYMQYAFSSLGVLREDTGEEGFSGRKNEALRKYGLVDTSKFAVVNIQYPFVFHPLVKGGKRLTPIMWGVYRTPLTWSEWWENFKENMYVGAEGMREIFPWAPKREWEEKLNPLKAPYNASWEESIVNTLTESEAYKMQGNIHSGPVSSDWNVVTVRRSESPPAFTPSSEPTRRSAPLPSAYFTPGRNL
jgi:hypothetical protein